MRIGIDARFYGPDSKGLGRYTQKLITNLEKVDDKNDYVIFLRKDNFDIYVPQNSRFTKVLADYRWYSFGEQFLFPFALYRSKCDLVHFLHFNVPILYFKKFIVTIHDLILLRYPTRKASTRNFLFYWIKFFLYRFVIAVAVRHSQKIIAVSKFTKDDVCAQYSRVCKKTCVVHEAAEPVVYNRAVDEQGLLSQYGIMGEYMLYVGNAYPHKNLFALVDAFALYVKRGGEVQGLVLVGKDDYFYAQLEAYIASKDITYITVLHTVDDDVLQVLYKNATVFVFPSLYEGFGLPPLEAQLWGIPVLSSDHPCMREILSSQGALYADAKDVTAFSHAMHKIVSSKGLREQLIVQGHKNTTRYSWKKMAKCISKIYENTM